MRTYIVAVLGAACLAACAANDAPYGNFLASPVAANDERMAGDAVKQLVAVYPPARTRLSLRQATPDVFGAALVKSLRGNGYALREFTPGPDKAMPAPASDGVQAGRTTATPAPPSAFLPFGYVLDVAAAPNLYRVTLSIGRESLTRPYLARDGSVYPAGAWVRRE